MISNDRTLSEAALDLVSGGLRDRPEQDYVNKLAADANRTGFGGAIGDIVPGIVVQGSGPNTPGNPISGL
jgi:hypothetical protein